MQDVITVSDIMSYTLVSNYHRNGQQILPRAPNLSPRDRVLTFVKENEIYVHSKCAIFQNRERGGESWATIGSANINRRSLGRADGTQDSEMNIWWRKEPGIDRFRQRLWEHHLGPRAPALLDEEAWDTRAWWNLRAIMEGVGTPLKGHVVRLDVVDRYDHL